MVIGSGPAGLVAATYLGRFHRRTLLVSEGASRAEWIPQTRNVPAYPDGLEGAELLLRLRHQTDRYGVVSYVGRARQVERGRSGFTLTLPGLCARAPTMILATGVEDRLPESLCDQWAAVRAGYARLCPICDGYELSGEPIFVLGPDAHAARETLFLRGYSDHVTLFTDGHAAAALPSPEREQLRQAGVRVVDDPVNRITAGGAGVQVSTVDGHCHEARAVYLALGVRVHSEVAVALGARCDAEGYLLVDSHQQTSVPCLYAAGDVVQSLSQISVAFGQATIAACAVHNALRERGLLEQAPGNRR